MADGDHDVRLRNAIDGVSVCVCQVRLRNAIDGMSVCVCLCLSVCLSVCGDEPDACCGDAQSQRVCGSCVTQTRVVVVVAEHNWPKMHVGV